MKKILSMLIAIGLTATTASSAVACTSTVKAKDVNVDPIDETAVFTKSMELPKGTTLMADEKNKEILEIIASQLKEESDDKTLLGIIMKPSSEIKLKEQVTEAEINDASFYVELTDVINDISKQDEEIFTLKNDKKVDITVVMDLSNPISKKEKKADWTLTEMEQIKDEMSVAIVKDKIKVNLNDAYKPTLDYESQTSDNKSFTIDTVEIDQDVELNLNDISVAGLPEGITVVNVNINDNCELVVTLNKPIQQTDKIQDFKLTWTLTNGSKLTSKLMVDSSK